MTFPIQKNLRHRATSGVVLIALLCGASAAFALDTSKLKPTGYVNDFANVIRPDMKQAMETYLTSVEAATKAQIAVVTVPSLDDEPVEDVAVRLFQEWKIGPANTDEGVLVLLAINDRKNRIEVGYGLEQYITDGQAGSILRGIRPMLRQGDYGAALYAAVQQIGQRIAQGKGVTIPGQPIAQPVERYRDGSDGGDGIGGAIIGFIILMFILGLFNRGGRGGPRGGLGGALPWIILGSAMNSGRRRGGPDHWGGGGFGGGGWGGGGGGGGFGGFGGGSSGGGGASGGW